MYTYDNWNDSQQFLTGESICIFMRRVVSHFYYLLRKISYIWQTRNKYSLAGSVDLNLKNMLGNSNTETKWMKKTKDDNMKLASCPSSFKAGNNNGVVVTFCAAWKTTTCTHT